MLDNIGIIAQCAWCMKENGQPLGDGSHGICEAHSSSVLAAYRLEKEQKSLARFNEESVAERALPGKSYFERFKHNKQ